MEMINRALEDVSDFRGMMRTIEQPVRDDNEMQKDLERRLLANDARVVPAVEGFNARDLQRELMHKPSVPPKRPGENREQYRARLYSRA